LDIPSQLSAPLAVDLLCNVLGLKNATFELKKKLIIWSERSADTGDRYPLLENA
jgi:hypothetical protein